jgi:hypothetical protein
VRAWRASVAGLGIALALAACAGRQASDSGPYRSSKGFRVVLPGGDWHVMRESRADLELRHRQVRAGILVNASCNRGQAQQTLAALDRQILAGFSLRDVQTRETISVAGRQASHIVLEGQTSPQGERVRVELLAVRGDRCVYDLVYAAAPADFARGREDFQRLVATFTLE